MIALRPILATLLLSVLATGGVVLPAVHEVVHGLEAGTERAEHREAFHTEADGDVVETPCPPRPHDVDCAVCSGLSTGVALTAIGPPTASVPDVSAAESDRDRRLAAAGAGARAPPVA